MTTSTETAPRALRRSTDGRVVAGVAAGLARYLGTDPVVLRVAFVALALLPPGIGLVAYLVSWIVIPSEGAPAQGGADAARNAPAVATATAARVIGALLVALGVLIAVEIAAPAWIDFDGRYVGAGVVILLGLGLLFRGARD